MKFCVKSIAALLILAFEAVPVIAQGNSIGAHIQSISPASAVTTPGTEVSVRGAGFEAGAEVYFGGIQGRITNFFSPTSLMVITPFLRPGRYT
ncbi:MAG: IPT/TIG domain-containing protein, partial [Candidatus Acidiferrales bacterium]